MKGIYRWPVNPPHKRSVMRKKVFIWWRHHERWLFAIIQPYHSQYETSHPDVSFNLTCATDRTTTSMFYVIRCCPWISDSMVRLFFFFFKFNFSMSKMGSSALIRALFSTYPFVVFNLFFNHAWSHDCYEMLCFILKLVIYDIILMI